MASVTTRPGALQAWLQPLSEATTANKRKRDSDDPYQSDAGSSNEGTESLLPAKKTQKKGPVKPKATGNRKPATKATAKPGAPAKEAKKLYTDKLKEVEKRYLDLDKKVKAMSPNSRSITVENYAISAAKHANVVTKLIDMDMPVLAFNFAMALADASHCSITSFRMSGESGDCNPFERLDKVLVAAIAAREVPVASACLSENELPTVPKRFTEDVADVGEFKTGRPNKQQRGWLATAYIYWEKARRLARRERRGACGRWP